MGWSMCVSVYMVTALFRKPNGGFSTDVGGFSMKTFFFFEGGHLEELGLCHVYKAEENAHKVE